MKWLVINMSYRRSLSFAEDEEELLKYFDSNGKSDIAKEAMKFHKEYKNRVITDTMIDLIKIIGFNKPNQEVIKNNISQDKLSKLKK